jgi:two-component system chemotaxis sensor kinase CheA
MSDSERREIIREFLEGTQIHMQKLEEKLLLAGRSLQEGTEIAAGDMEEMFQSIHTIKGTASLAGLGKTVTLAHQWGTILRYLCEHNLALTCEWVESFRAAIEGLKALRKDLEEKNEEAADIGEILARLEKSFDTWKTEEDKAPPAKTSCSAEFSTEIDEKYIEVYLEDTEQNIEHFNDDLVALEKDPAQGDLINNLFRIMHTIKGSSGMVNVVDVQEVAHAMENLFSIVRDRQEALPDMFPLLFQAIDLINSRIAALRRKEKISLDTTEVIHAIEAYVEGLACLPTSDRQAADKKDKRPRAPQAVPGGKINSLEKVLHSPKDRAVLVQAVDHKNKVYQISVSLEESVSLKSMKAFLVEEHLKNKGIIVLMSPRPEDIDDSVKGALFLDILFCTVLKEKELIPLLSVGEVSVAGIKQVTAQEIKDLLEQQFLVSPSGLSMAGRQAAGMEDTTKEDQADSMNTPEGQMRGSSVLAQTATIRIDARKLDTLMNLSGELVTIRAQFERLVSLLSDEILSQRDFMRSVAHLKSNLGTLTSDLRAVATAHDGSKLGRLFRQWEDLNAFLNRLDQRTGEGHLTAEIHSIDEMTGILGKVASDIQAAVMQARMVPIKGVFTRFNRIVRDIGRDLGKDVDLVIEGEETELDKNLVDNLGEPLTHMIRNAIDHGIEDVAARQKLGKPAKGTILLKAFHEGNNVCIEVRDDGKGLNPEMLADSALKKRLITAEHAKRLTDREKLDLMFLPGFSTAAQVTSLSGRGVGMDVVRSMIVAMNGVIDIESDIGQGTTFILKIPLTLAIIQALLIVVDGEIYALPLDAVTEIMKVKSDTIHSIDGNDTVQLRDQVLSLIELRDVIHIRGSRPPQEKIKRVVVISDGKSQVGVVVDKLIGESEIVIKALSHHFFNVKGISGVTILGDGQIALILDPKLIIMESR